MGKSRQALADFGDTLVVEVGRKAGDGLPDKATGAALMIYASGVDEAEAVRETVATSLGRLRPVLEALLAEKGLKLDDFIDAPRAP